MIELATERKTAPITVRQREVVALIAAGCSNDEVGLRLGISPRTAKAHCDVLRQKLGVRRPPSNPDRVPTPHGRGSAVCGAPLRDCGSAPPLTQRRSRLRPRAPPSREW